MGAALGAAENLGIKGDFKQRVQDVLQPGTSAILVILRKATYDKFVEALRPYGGRGRRRPDRLVPRAVTLAGRVMWLCTASSSLVTKRTSERERWINEE